MGFIHDVLHYGKLHNYQRKSYFVFNVQENKDDVTIEDLKNIVRKDLRICINDASARTKIRILFTSYVSAIRRNVQVWAIEEHRGIAVKTCFGGDQTTVVQAESCVKSTINKIALERRL